MKKENVFKRLFVVFPSLAISIFYVLNALDKLLNYNQTDKIIDNGFIMIGVGIFLLVSVVLFLYSKTAHIGATLLAIYMISIVFIHMYKGKPYEVAILIVMSTIFASYIRNPKLFRYTLQKD